MRTFLLAVVLIIIVALLVAFGYKKFNGGGYKEDIEFLKQFDGTVFNINMLYDRTSSHMADNANASLEFVVDKFPKLIAIANNYLSGIPCVAQDDPTHRYACSELYGFLGNSILKKLEEFNSQMRSFNVFRIWPGTPDFMIEDYKKFYEEFEPLASEIGETKIRCPICSANRGLHTKAALRREYVSDDEEE